jgi:transposase-like protein
MTAKLPAHFTNADAARVYLENQRWPDGVTCPHCGADDVTSMKGKAHRPGVYQCNACREQFTVTVGTVFERSKIPLNTWLYATHLLCSSKKGISSHQLHRMIGVTYKTAWFMTHRIREAMKEAAPDPIGGEGKIVEADETYFGRRENPRPSPKRKGAPPLKRKHAWDKRAVVSLVERGGRARTFHVDNATKAEIREVLVRNVDRKSALHTDESRLYSDVGTEFASHRTTKHSAGEYVRWEDGEAIHSNTVEGYFSVFKRGMKGVYQHCGEAHLHRYLVVSPVMV